MNNSTIKVILAGTASALALAAQAQSGEPVKALPTLHVSSGVVMVSTGGEFVSASSGEQLVDGERLMVSKGSSATVVYSEHCQRTYDKPGVYKIDLVCTDAVATESGALTTAAIVAGVVAAGVIVNRNKGSGNNGEPNRNKDSGNPGEPISH